MIYKSLLTLVLGCLIYQFSWAQESDTLTVMHYNLMNYRNTTSFCTETNNNSDQKDKNLGTIFNYVKPDIFTVNEMGSNWLNPSKILKNAININGIDKYEQAEFASNGNSSLANMLFYNSEKLVLYKQSDITKATNGTLLVRSIDLYTLYYNHPFSLEKGDTIFVNIAVAHLKAGSSGGDKNSRALQTAALMDYLDKNNQRINYLFCGDLNIQSSNEDSYQNLTQHSNTNIRYYDPVDVSGTWNNKSAYSDLHTQSTRTSSNGCFSGGGMDDRFDFILFGAEFKSADYNMKYINGSYEALGQDANRFNGSINSPKNIVVPSNIADALYNMSDHLPVIMDIQVNPRYSNISDLPIFKASISNPVTDKIWIESPNTISSYQLYTIDGQLKKSNDHLLKNEFQIDVFDLQSGMYIVKLKDESGLSLTKKIFKSK